MRSLCRKRLNQVEQWVVKPWAEPIQRWEVDRKWSEGHRRCEMGKVGVRIGYYRTKNWRNGSHMACDLTLVVTWCEIFYKGVSNDLRPGRRGAPAAPTTPCC